MTAGIEGCLGLLVLALLPAQEATLAVETAERTRQAIDFRSNTSPGSTDPASGSLTVEYGERGFTEAEARTVLASAAGARLALSAGFPATYDIDLPLAFGKTKLEPGLHLVLLERFAGGWQLVFVRFETALAAGWTGGPEVPGAGTAVAVEATEQPEGKGKPGHRLWTGPRPDGRGLAFFARFGRLSLSAELEAKARKGQPAAWESKRLRSSVRAGASGPVLASVEHGPLGWNAGLQEELDGLKAGKRWALAKDHWTNLVVLAPLQLGGVAVAPGEYSLVLERAKGDDAWSLGLIASGVRRKAFTNAFNADKLEAAVRVPFAREVPAVSADELDVRFADEPARLEAHVGPNRWKAPVARAP